MLLYGAGSSILIGAFIVILETIISCQTLPPAIECPRVRHNLRGASSDGLLVSQPAAQAGANTLFASAMLLSYSGKEVVGHRFL